MWTSHATLFVFCFIFSVRGTFFEVFFYYLASGCRSVFFKSDNFRDLLTRKFFYCIERSCSTKRFERLRTLTLISTLTGMQHRDTREASRLIKHLVLQENLLIKSDSLLISLSNRNFPINSIFFLYFLFKVPFSYINFKILSIFYFSLENI